MQRRRGEQGGKKSRRQEEGEGEKKRKIKPFTQCAGSCSALALSDLPLAQYECRPSSASCRLLSGSWVWTGPRVGTSIDDDVG